jgi:hypothetical protein
MYLTKSELPSVFTSIDELHGVLDTLEATTPGGDTITIRCIAERHPINLALEAFSHVKGYDLHVVRYTCWCADQALALIGYTQYQPLPPCWGARIPTSSTEREHAAMDFETDRETYGYAQNAHSHAQDARDDAVRLIAEYLSDGSISPGDDAITNVAFSAAMARRNWQAHRVSVESYERGTLPTSQEIAAAEHVEFSRIRALQKTKLIALCEAITSNTLTDAFWTDHVYWTSP